MKAWLFTNTGEPLVLTNIPEPTAAPQGVVLQIKAAGLCHSDVSLLENEEWLSLVAKRPIVMGHETAGEVIEIGEGVTEYVIGDRVSVCPTTPAGAPGFSFDGGFGERMAVPAEALLRIPEAVGWAYGAAATDAGMASYSAVISQGAVKAGHTVGIIGFGGLGQVGARIAVLAGATVYVAEVNEHVWPLTTEIGAAGVAADILDFFGVEFDVIVDFAGFGTTTAAAIEAIRPGGSVVVVGMGKLEANISTKSLIVKSCMLKGSRGGSKSDIAAVYEYMRTGQLKPAITTIHMTEIADGLARLSRGEVVGRLVAVFD